MADIGTLECGFSLIDRTSDKVFNDLDKRVSELSRNLAKAGNIKPENFSKFENLIGNMISKYNTAVMELNRVVETRKVAPKLIDETEYNSAVRKVSELKKHIESLFSMDNMKLEGMINTSAIRESLRVAFMSTFKMFDEFNQKNTLVAKSFQKQAAKSATAEELGKMDKSKYLQTLERLSKAWDDVTKARNSYMEALGNRQNLTSMDKALLQNFGTYRKKLAEEMGNPSALGVINLLGADKNLLIGQAEARAAELRKENASIADGVTARTKQELKDNETRRQSLRILEDEYRKLNTAMEAAKLTKLAPDMDTSRINNAINKIKAELQEIEFLKKLISNGSTIDIKGTRVHRENLLSELGLSRREDTIARSQYEYLQNKYKEIASARQKLVDAKPFANGLEKSALDARIRQLDDYKKKLENLQLGSKNALRDANGASLVGSQLTELISQAKSFAKEVTDGAKKASQEMDVMRQQTARANNEIASLTATANKMGNIKTSAQKNGLTDIANEAGKAQREIKAVIREWDNWKSKIAMGAQMKPADFMNMTGLRQAAMRSVGDLTVMSNNLKMLEGRIQSLQSMRDTASRTINNLQAKGIDTADAENKLSRLKNLIAQYNTLKVDPVKIAKLDTNQIAIEYKQVTGEMQRALPVIKEAEKARKDEARANQYVEDTIRKLNNAYQTSGNKKFVAGVDTTRLQKARQDIADFVSMLENMRRMGQSINIPDVRSFRKDLLSELRIASSQTNASESQITRELRQIETLEKKYQELDKVRATLNNAKNGASSSDIAEIDKRIRALDAYEQRLRSLKLGSKDAFLDANGASLVGSQFSKLVKEAEIFAKSVVSGIKEFDVFTNQTARADLEIQRLVNTLHQMDSFRIDALNNGFAMTASIVDTAQNKIESLIARWEQWKMSISNGQFMTQADYLNMQTGRMNAMDTFNNAKAMRKTESTESQNNAVAAKQRERDNEKYLSQLNTIAGRIASLKRLRESLNQRIGTASNLGIDTTAARKSLDEINTKIDYYNKLVKSTPKETVIGITLRSNDIRPVTDGARKAIGNLGSAIKQTEQTKKSDAKTTQSLVKEYERLASAANKSGQALEKMKNLAMQFAPVYGVQQLVMSIIEVGGEIEKQHIALQAIIGDMQQANAMFAQIKNLALQSPFTFGELNRDVKQLAAYSYEYDELYDTTKRIADLSAGLGVSFERIALAMGQTKSRGFLDGKELRQFAYAGIPLLKKLSDMYTDQKGTTVTTAQVKKMVSQNKVSYEDVQKVLWDMTDAGGQFYNMQLTLSETLYGRWNKLKDAWEIMLSEFASGDSLVGKVMKTILNGITSVVLGFNKATYAVQGLIAAIAAIKFSNLGGGRQMGNNILAMQRSVASNLTARAMGGEKLTPMQQSIIANQNKITRSTLQTLISNKAINATQLRQLYVSGQINRSLYASVAATNAWSVSANRVTGQFHLMGTAINGIFTKLGSGLMNFVSGNWVSLAIGAITAVAMYWVEKYQEIDRAAKKTSDEALDKLQQLKDFTAKMNINLIIGKGDEEINDAIEQYKEKIKGIAPGMYGDIMSRLWEQSDSSAMSAADKLKFLDEQVHTLEQGMELASNRAKIFFDALESANGWTTEDVKSNLEDYSDALSGFQKEVKKIDFRTLSEGFKKLSTHPDGHIRAMAKDMKDAYDAGANLETLLGKLQSYALKTGEYDLRTGVFSGDYNKALRDTFGDDFLNARNHLEVAQKDITDQIKVLAEHLKDELGRNFATNPIKKTAYKTIVESMKNQMELTPEQGTFFELKLNEAVGIKNSEVLTSDIAKEVGKTLPRDIRNQILLGKELEGASRKKAEGCIKEAAEAAKSKFPEFADDIQRMLDAKEFTATILLKYVEEEKGFTDEQKNAASVLPMKGLGMTEEEEAWIKNNVTEGNTYKTKEKIHQTIDSLYRTMNRSKEIAKKRPSEANQKQAEKDEQAYQKYIAMNKKIFGDDYAGKEKGNNGSKKDAIAEMWRRRLSLLKEYQAEFDKFSKQTDKGAEGAVEYLSKASNGDWSKLLDFMGSDKNMKDPEQMMRDFFTKQISGKAKTEQQKEVEKNTIKEVTGIDFKYASEDFKNELDNLKKSISETAEDIESYHSLLKAGLSKRDAASITIGDNSASRLDNLYQILGRYTKDRDVSTIVSSDDSELQSKYDSNWQTVKTVATEIYNLQRQFMKDGYNTIAEAMNKLNTVAANTAKIEAAYNETIRKINEGAKARWKEENPNGDISKAKIEYTPAEQRAIEIATVEKNLKLFEASIEYLKGMNAPLAQSKRELQDFKDRYLKRLADAFKAGTISAKDYAKKIQDVNNLMHEAESTPGDAESYFKGGIDNALSNRKKRYDQEQVNNLLDQEKFINMAKENPGKGYEQLAAQSGQFAQNAAAASQSMSDMQGTMTMIDLIVHGINGVVQGIKGAFDEINKFNMAQGAEDESYSKFGAFINAFSSASQSATDAWDSFKNGDIGGVIKGGVGSITNWFTPFFEAHDKRLEEQIKKDDERMKQESWYYNQVLSLLRKSAAGIFSKKSIGNLIKLNKQTDEGLKEYSIDLRIKELETEASAIEFGQLMKQYGLSDNPYTSPVPDDVRLNQIEKEIESLKAQKQNSSDTTSYYGALKNSLEAKRQSAENKVKAAEEEKDSDQAKIDGYKDELYEIEEEIRDLAETIAKEFYKIDLKGWSDSISNALMDAWATGKNAVKAYGDTVRDVMRNVVSSVIQQKVIGSYFEDQFEGWYKKFEDKKGVMDDELFEDLFTIMSGGKKLTDQAYGILDAANQAYTKISGSSLKGRVTGMSPSIAGVTEDTADLLSSQIEGIRSDESMERILMENIDKNVELISKWKQDSEDEESDVQNIRTRASQKDIIIENNDAFMSSYMTAIHQEVAHGNFIIQSLVDEQIPNIGNQLAMQLAEMKRIEVNTHRSADASEDIRDILSSLTNGSGVKKMSIAMS